ncbi:MAG TPA: biopolymer transporter ExbD, partial [Flavisolibacter sp.]|nr:biopolymer transporter ExbD [Flavisolibacter sp.]
EETGKTKRKLHKALSIDMTPMVDLGFLLITFFIFTTTMTEKHAMKLFMPKEGEPSPIPESKAVTIVLGQQNKVYAYEGNWKEALQHNAIMQTTYDESTGIGNVLRIKQKFLRSKGVKDDEGLMLLIKPMEHSSYKNVVDALDETAINNVKRYAIIDPTVEERQYFKQL